MRSRATTLVLLALTVAAAGCNGRLRSSDEPRADSAPPPEDSYYDDGVDQEASGDEGYAEDSGGYATEADRTAAMESRSAEAQSEFQDAMAEARTPEEKAAAYQKYEDARREVNQMAEGGGGADDDSYGPPP